MGFAFNFKEFTLIVRDVFREILVGQHHKIPIILFAYHFHFLITQLDDNRSPIQIRIPIHPKSFVGEKLLTGCKDY